MTLVASSSALPGRAAKGRQDSIINGNVHQQWHEQRSSLQLAAAHKSCLQLPELVAKATILTGLPDELEVVGSLADPTATSVHPLVSFAGATIAWSSGPVFWNVVLPAATAALRPADRACSCCINCCICSLFACSSSSMLCRRCCQLLRSSLAAPCKVRVMQSVTRKCFFSKQCCCCSPLISLLPVIVLLPSSSLHMLQQA